MRLPPAIRACLFDLDGVLTRTTAIHAKAWKGTFDTYLRERAARRCEAFVPFDAGRDYDAYVDGRERNDGVRAFLASRGIELPEGDPGDAPGAETISGLGNRKSAAALTLIRERGVETYDGSVRFVRAARQAGLRTAVVSASSNCRAVLEAARIPDLFDVRIDAVVARQERLCGKPAPDMFLAAAQSLGVEPRQAAIVEDALTGIDAGKAGGFGFVVGVDRTGQAQALRAHGADVVVSDLAELLG